MPHALPANVRFFQFVIPAPANACWEWTGTKDGGGYGLFWTGSNKIKAHRFAYQLLIGEIPDGLVMDHLCLNKWCVNPLHVEPVTQRENVQRWQATRLDWPGRTHCKHGHEYTPENEARYFNKTLGVWQKRCRECSNKSKRDARRAMKEAA